MNSTRKIGYEINSVSNMLKRNAPRLEKSPTRMQMWIISYIRNNSERDIFQGELERTFNITRATASDILKRMERDGFVIRKSATHDARMKKITLTDEAIQIADEIRRNILKNEYLMARDISADDLNTFFRVIDKIKENLQNINEQ